MFLAGWIVVRMTPKIIIHYNCLTYMHLWPSHPKKGTITGIRMGWAYHVASFSSICARMAYLGLKLRLDNVRVEMRKPAEKM